MFVSLPFIPLLCIKTFSIFSPPIWYIKWQNRMHSTVVMTKVNKAYMENAIKSSGHGKLREMNEVRRNCMHTYACTYVFAYVYNEKLLDMGRVKIKPPTICC